MRKGMTLTEFKAEWYGHFLGDISKKDFIQKVVETGDYIWHIFSWELIEKDKYLTGDEARKAYDKLYKANSYYILPFERNSNNRSMGMNPQHETAKALDEYVEIYVVAEDCSWTYIKTHESELGPYFYKIK